MITRPRFFPYWICTRVASCSDRISSTSAMPASVAGVVATSVGASASGGRLEVAPHEILGLAHGEVLGGDPEGEGVHGVGVTESQQRTGVSRLDPGIGEELLGLEGELQQTDRVRDV